MNILECYIMYPNLFILKRLVELVCSSDCTLAVILGGHPKLSNDLKRPSMEEIGARSQIFYLNHWVENKLHYGSWLFKQCCSKDVTQDDIITTEAMEPLINSLVTPLQINHYLSRGLEQGYTIGVKPIIFDIIQSVLVPDLNSSTAELSRHGYNIQVLCEILNARSPKIRAYLQGHPNPNKAQDFANEIHKLGIV